jgi:hypothetical protein
VRWKWAVGSFGVLIGGSTGAIDDHPSVTRRWKKS